ncbi:MAG TPA: tRNA (adenosine(37)-N6)-threonylcarbamoyltransferase complex transferase subunit TsaD [Gemmatimonadaceae bacterium]|nr:tRNA (adenosine(37)-N6)-threonylcarbamoyltransferase complex transferase subunit TsaD [Gemmatimonadaceae bacterium]
MRVLGIETSCDETSAAVVEGDERTAAMRSLVILSQDVHRVFGGVVPEIASREHLTAVVPVVRRALADASLGLSGVDGIAVTNAPGLVGALLVGVSFAKALAFALGKPLIGVHHMEGHLFAASLEVPDAVPPFTALLVSGGHTMIVDVPEWGAYRVLGKTRDDAAGEAFDKVGKLLGLPYPGGPHVESRAAKAARPSLRYSPPMLRRDQQPDSPEYYDVSFSGLKTAVLNTVRERERSGPLTEEARGEIARAFQDALIATLVGKTERAVASFGRARVVVAGGVAANRALIAALTERLAKRSVSVIAPSNRLSTDNAAMIARAGLHRLQRGERSGLDLTAFATRPLPGASTA